MELGFGIGTSAIMVALALAFAAADARFGQPKAAPARAKPSASVVVVLFCLVPFVVMAMVQIPYIALYCGVWIACVVATSLGERRGRWSWFIPNITAALIVLVHLVTSAALAVFSRSTLYQIAADPLMRCIALVATVAVAAVTFRMVQAMLDSEGGSFSGSVRLLTWFSWTALAFIAFDALSLDVATGSDILSLYSLLSGLLLAIGVIAFLISASKLGRTAYLEQEYLKLAEEAQAEEARAAELRHRAYTDALTSLASRRSALETLQALLEADQPFSVVFIDMNDLKTINDSLGHSVGDACLIRLAETVRNSFGAEATISRIGGDELLVVLRGSCAQDAFERAKAALDVLAAPNESTPPLSFCFGIVDSSAGLSSPSQVIERSDLVMYEHKKRYHCRDANADAAFRHARDGGDPA